MDPVLQAIIGLAGVRYNPVVSNTTAAYTTEAKVDVPGAQEMTKSPNKSDYTIPADDGIYATGSLTNYEDITYTAVELNLLEEAWLQGAEFDEATKSYKFAELNAPTVALGFASLKMDGTYRMFLYPTAKLLSIELAHKSKSTEGIEVQPYKLTFRAVRRQFDNVLRLVADSSGTDFAWLDTIEQLPVTPPEGGGG